jgi:hypothetical protein
VSEFRDGFRAGWMRGHETGYRKALERVKAAISMIHIPVQYSDDPERERALMDELERRLERAQAQPPSS